jgi:hypothetical protein
MGILLTKGLKPGFWRSKYPELIGISLVLAYLALARELLPIPLCPSMIFSDIPCPTCGITRSMWSIFHGDWVRAFRFNPLGFLAVFLFVRRLLVLTMPRNRLLEVIDHRRMNQILGLVFFALYFSMFFYIVNKYYL